MLADSSRYLFAAHILLEYHITKRKARYEIFSDLFILREFWSIKNEFLKF